MFELGFLSCHDSVMFFVVWPCDKRCYILLLHVPRLGLGTSVKVVSHLSNM